MKSIYRFGQTIRQGLRRFAVALLLISGAFSQTPGSIVSTQLLDSMPVSQVQYLLNIFLGSFAPTAIYDIEIYQVVYNTTDPFGEPTVASGAVTIPVDGNHAYPMLAYQHGTTTLRDDVSSVTGLNPLNMWLGTTGYITVEADYLGLGVSTLLHPYIMAEPTATSVVDMMRAARSFCDDLPDLQYHSQLFLAGYSEGGYATMVTHAQIETNHPDEFQVTASFPMAGPYDLSDIMLNMILAGTPYANPFYMPYILLAYIEYYSLGAVGDFFLPEYAEILPGLFDGTLSGSEINAYLPDVPLDMLIPSVVDELTNNPEHPFRQALEENDAYNWTPIAPMYMYHGMGDDQVPFANSQVAYDAFIQNGATDVHLMAIPSYYNSHSAAALPCLATAFNVMDVMSYITERGDLNEDQIFSVLDIIIQVGVILYPEGISSYKFWAADVNTDGEVNVLDILDVVLLVLGG